MEVRLVCWIYGLFVDRCKEWCVVPFLTLILLTWRIWWAPNNARKGQMGFNSAFKGLRLVNQEAGSEHVRNRCSTCLNPVISCVTHIEECLIISIRSRSRCNPLRGLEMAFSMALLSQVAQLCAFSTEHMHTVFPLVCKKMAYMCRTFLKYALHFKIMFFAHKQ